jgi:predicted nucleic acid-binding protein
MPAAGRRTTAVDSSVAVPLLVATHDDHAAVARWARGRSLALTAHSVAETYSVLTRLPEGLRAEPGEVARAMAADFASPLLVGDDTLRRLPTVLAERGVAGGAVYDALVALAAAECGAVLATRDTRAV